MSALRRIGAFSTYAGMVSLYFGFMLRHHRHRFRAFMLLYVVAGLGFGLTDAQYFAGTAYHRVKMLIGVTWLLALVLAWRRPRS